MKRRNQKNPPQMSESGRKKTEDEDKSRFSSKNKHMYIYFILFHLNFSKDIILQIYFKINLYFLKF